MSYIATCGTFPRNSFEMEQINKKMEMTSVLIGAVFFLAAFTQSLSGFGVALVAMALLPGLIGIKSAIPLVALVATLVDFGVLARYWRSLQVQKIWPLILASFFSVPLGILLLRRLDESLTLTILGVILAGYALYALLGLRLPELKGRLWAYAAGFLGGLLGGAYNTPGPPIIIYASCKQWEPDVFKGNLQSFFLLNSIVVLVGHALSGNFTASIQRMFWSGLPWIAFGMLAGLSMDRWVKPEVFRKIALVLLLVMGANMIL